MDQQISQQIDSLNELLWSGAVSPNNFGAARAEAVIMDVINYIKSFPSSLRQVEDDRIEVIDVPVGASHACTLAQSLTGMLGESVFKATATADLAMLVRHVYLNLTYPLAV